MIILIFRHAARAVISQSNDCSLSERGHQQATALCSAVGETQLPTPTKLIASPKKRAQQTFRPLSQHLGLELLIEDALDELKEGENMQTFRERVAALLEKLAEPNEDHSVTYLCSHSDWIDEALSLIPSDHPELESLGSFSNAQFITFKIKAGVWHVIS